VRLKKVLKAAMKGAADTLMQQLLSTPEFQRLPAPSFALEVQRGSIPGAPNAMEFSCGFKLDQS
jgi:hypothetical protein